jgi:hypothetical protein
VPPCTLHPTPSPGKQQGIGVGVLYPAPDSIPRQATTTGYRGGSNSIKVQAIRSCPGTGNRITGWGCNVPCTRQHPGKQQGIGGGGWGGNLIQVQATRSCPGTGNRVVSVDKVPTTCITGYDSFLGGKERVEVPLGFLYAVSSLIRISKVYIDKVMDKVIWL